MSLDRGTKLGPYEVLDPLGAGGMGEVYRARDLRLDRTVAIKVLPAGLAVNGDLRRRLEREARAVSSLSHPHICTLFDVGRENGVDFLVLEYLEGEPRRVFIVRLGSVPNETGWISYSFNASECGVKPSASVNLLLCAMRRRVEPCRLFGGTPEFEG